MNRIAPYCTPEGQEIEELKPKDYEMLQDEKEQEQAK